MRNTDHQKSLEQPQETETTDNFSLPRREDLRAQAQTEQSREVEIAESLQALEEKLAHHPKVEKTEGAQGEVSYSFKDKDSESNITIDYDGTTATVTKSNAEGEIVDTQQSSPGGNTADYILNYGLTFSPESPIDGPRRGEGRGAPQGRGSF